MTAVIRRFKGGKVVDEVDLARASDGDLRALRGRLETDLTGCQARVDLGGDPVFVGRAHKAAEHLRTSLMLVVEEQHRRERRVLDKGEAEAKARVEQEVIEQRRQAKDQAKRDRIALANDRQQRIFAVFKGIVREHVKDKALVDSWLEQARLRADAGEGHTGEGESWKS